MSDNDFYPKWVLEDLTAEIASLRAELERTKSAFRGMVEIKDDVKAALEKAEIERDEARCLARRLYREYTDTKRYLDHLWEL